VAMHGNQGGNVVVPGPADLSSEGGRPLTSQSVDIT
jgi:hypothetical protein